jgi:hypothetical protein
MQRPGNLKIIASKLLFIFATNCFAMKYLDIKYGTEAVNYLHEIELPNKSTS